MVKVTAHTKEEAENCPVRSVLTKVTAKWNLLILLTLEDGELRFGELKRAIGDVTQRVLTENLRLLERDGHLTRTVHPGRKAAPLATALRRRMWSSVRRSSRMLKPG